MAGKDRGLQGSHSYILLYFSRTMQTYGWDSVFVMSVAEANKQLAANMSQLIDTFSFTDTEGLAPTTISGTFGAWQIVPGGANTIIQMKLPIQTGTMSVGGAGTYSLNGVAVEVKITLSILPSHVPNQQALTFAFSGSTVGTAQGIELVKVDDPTDQVPQTYEQVLGNAVVACLLANTAEITYVFATIDLMPGGSDSWLTPAESVFYYQQPIGSQSYLCILSMLTPQDVSHKTPQVDPSLLNTAYDWMMAIPPGVFLQYVIMPTLPSVYGNGTSAGTFRYDSSKTAIVNTTSFGVGKVTSGLIDYYPRITSLSLSVSNNALHSVTSGDCDLYAGISMTYSVTANNAMVFNPNTQAFTFNADPNPSETHDDDIPLWEEVVLLGIVDIVMATVVHFIANDIADKLSAISSSRSFAGVSPAIVQWTGQNQLNIKAGGLSTSFYMQGNL
jgi:hypothetical protein